MAGLGCKRLEWMTGQARGKGTGRGSGTRNGASVENVEAGEGESTRRIEDGSRTYRTAGEVTWSWRTRDKLLLCGLSWWGRQTEILSLTRTE